MPTTFEEKFSNFVLTTTLPEQLWSNANAYEPMYIDMSLNTFAFSSGGVVRDLVMPYINVGWACTFLQAANVDLWRFSLSPSNDNPNAYNALRRGTPNLMTYLQQFLKSIASNVNKPSNVEVKLKAFNPKLKVKNATTSQLEKLDSIQYVVENSPEFLKNLCNKNSDYTPIIKLFNIQVLVNRGGYKDSSSKADLAANYGGRINSISQPLAKQPARHTDQAE